ncbi:MAG TPA: threonine synthase [Bryobacteraceae bacterium]|jgi:threonine synthase|nr:threonine synthase [Bryobacteraceae bacterium]
MHHVTHLECSLCPQQFDAGRVHNLCSCGGTLFVRYDLTRVKGTWSRDSVRSGRTDLWRYLPVLPPRRPESIVSLGEGLTPLIRAHRLGSAMGAKNLWVKDEGLNPTASFKARGMTTAITMARELGIRKIAIPSAGNAASAAAAYAAAAGIEAHIFMPKDVPQANYIECQTLGAKVTLVDGLISDCGRIVAERKDQEGWFDMSTLKEPYRVEGKKTMGYEVAEQFDWELPDAIFYPTGGGVGMIGMWKAFEELEQLGWISSKPPKMIAVQAAGCQPIVRAFEQSAARSEFWQNASTVAAGLRVPKPLGDVLILNILRESGGTAIAISDQEILDAGRELASLEGIFAAPEGAACVTAARTLIANGFLKPADRIVLYNTGSGLKYLDAYSAATS